MNAFGWPFLVGRGRRTGHRVLLAPDFLVTQRDHGILETASPEVTELTSASGRRLSIRCSTHQITADDVAATENPRDEHGRPLRLIYGVVATGVTPVNADLPTALESALDTYRRFLRREDRFEVESASSFPLTATQPSTVDSPAVPRPSGPRRVAVLSVAAVIAALAITLTMLLPRSQPVPGSPCPGAMNATFSAPGAVKATFSAPATPSQSAPSCAGSVR